MYHELKFNFLLQYFLKKLTNENVFVQIFFVDKSKKEISQNEIIYFIDKKNTSSNYSKLIRNYFHLKKLVQILDKKYYYFTIVLSNNYQFLQNFFKVYDKLNRNK